tara:strand:- start:353 stop:556 length:204 start_codon:yes stop_codon:yes gene_type:complete
LKFNQIGIEGKILKKAIISVKTNAASSSLSNIKYAGKETEISKKMITNSKNFSLLIIADLKIIIPYF